MNLVFREGMLPAISGILIGIAGAFATRVLRTLLFAVKPTDPLTFTLVVAVFLLVALSACCVPARRAMRVDPLVALRYE